ncbi:MAG: tripartite tricarboxylate transporter substrate-binding protein [Armatimonadota bacterium]|nr:tripartite tricarboxylate transporter substrate-binding protein [Armatimonadota bacterium]
MRTVLAFLLAVLLGATAAPAWAQATFAGKTVTIIVGYPPGGGYDVMARMVARHLPRFLPGGPTVIVQNMPGANSIVAANHVFHVARPDGLTLGLFNRNLVLGQLVKVEGIRFDMARFGWVGSPATETTILAIRADLPYRTPADLRRADPAVVVGATGPGASTYDFPLLLKAFVGMNLRIISGYRSSGDIMLAIERKEADGRAGSYSSIKPFIDRGLVRPIVRGHASVPAIERLPVDEDLSEDPRAKAVMRLRSVPEVVGRPFVVPPATPAEFVDAYREAFRRMTADREFLAEAERAGFEIKLTPGDQALRTIREVLGAPPDVIRVFSQFYKFD